MDRREFLFTASAAALATSASPRLALAQEAHDLGGLADIMRNPPASVRPQVRWWWPGGTIDPAQVRAEAQQIAEAGFGGFEIADVRDSVREPIDPAAFGWGTPAWNRGVEAALEEAIRQGIMPSLTLGPHWPTGVPGVVPDDAAASKELVYGQRQLAAGETYRGPVPSPEQAKPSGVLAGSNENPPVTPELLLVQAYRIVGNDNGLPLLDPASRTLVESTSGTVDWTAPEGSDWLLLSFFMRGTGQIQNMFGMNKTGSMLADPIPYVLDIYGPAAVDALTTYWEKNLLSPRIRDLMRQSGGTFFEDSLELSFAFPWTPGAIEEFRTRRGYDLTPYLPLLVSRQPTFDEMIMGGGRPELFVLQGVDTERLRHDFDSMLSDMYVENRLEGLSRWAAGLGMKFRVQAIGSEINSGLAAAHADIPEGDNSNDIHGWRKLAAGRDIGGKTTILSDEAATFVKGIAHVATWKDALYMLQRDMVGGANQIMLHGFSYADAPGAGWPGFSAFGRAIGNDWGPRDPQWTMAPGVTAYLGRLQALLRDGRTHADLAVLGEPLKSQSVLQAGYTFQYPAMELFDRPQMRVEGGLLMPEGPAYRAIVLNALEAMDLSVAKRLEEHARAGLPIVIVGDAPQHARGWKDHAASDAAVAEIFARLARLPGVRRVARQSGVPNALGALGVGSYIRLATPHRILAQHRRTAGRQIFYLLNDSDTAVRQTVGLAAPGTAYRVDLWSGQLIELEPRRQGGLAEIDLALAPNEPAAIILSEQPVPGAVAIPTGPAEAFEKPLGPWHVELEDWLPAAGANETRRQTAKMEMAELKPWREIPGHEGMAGLARYRAVVAIARPVPTAAHIDLGRVEGAATLSVNGSPALPVNPFTNKAQIGHLLKTGENRIEIAVASPLNNRLMAEGIEEQGFKPPVNDDAPPPPPPPEPAAEPDPDLVDGPPAMAGMQPGSAPPGSERVYRDYGLLGPVILSAG